MNQNLMSAVTKITMVMALMASLCFSQEPPKVHDGQVTRSIILPAPGVGWSADFAIIQDLNGVDQNSFSYKDPKHQGTFNLTYKGHFLCETGCSFYGNFTQWYTPTAFAFGCVIYSGDLQGDFYQNGHLFSDVIGLYSQLWCGSNNTYRFAGGDVSFNLPPQ